VVDASRFVGYQHVCIRPVYFIDDMGSDDTTSGGGLPRDAAFGDAVISDPVSCYSRSHYPESSLLLHRLQFETPRGGLRGEKIIRHNGPSLLANPR